ncbi:hypothetical protein FQN54_001037 [Arachnomyces sp. PD_36]|nr:hypothetical protein FQN54_001037 [Arachnomyces sp. PD_36]
MIPKSLLILSLAVQVMAKGKRGLTYNDASLANLFRNSAEVTWGYNWGFTSNGLDPSFEFSPMLWGLPSGPELSWTSILESNDTLHALSFNEPDLEDQANITAADAAEGHRTFLEPFASLVKLSTPAVTNGPPPNMGTGWMQQFLDECSECTFDFAAIHWYSNNDPKGFKTYVQDFHESFGLPIWITEFAASGEEEEQISFLQEVLPWLDTQDYVERYSYFGVFPGFLANEAGDGLSALGEVYATYTG